MTGNRPTAPALGGLEEDWEHLEVHTRPPAGGGVNKRTFKRAAWSMHGNFVQVLVDVGRSPDEAYKEYWIPFALLVEIRVLHKWPRAGELERVAEFPPRTLDNPYK